MSASPQLPEQLIQCFILFISVCCTSNLERNCSSYKIPKDYIDGDTKGNDVSYGDCSFNKSFCNYTQACTNGSANNWTIDSGRAVCPGNIGEYVSYSMLLSPLLNITQTMSLVFNYTQNLPGRLSVLLVTRTGVTDIYHDTEVNEPLAGSVSINSSLIKIGFKARMAANNSFKVTLSHVKLQTVSYTTVPTQVSSMEMSSASGQSVTSSTQAGEPDTQKQEGGSHAGTVAGVVVAVVVVAASVGVGVFMWRRRKQQQNHKSERGTVRDDQNISESRDAGNLSIAATVMSSPSKPPTNPSVHFVNAGNKPVVGLMGISGHQYDVPRNGLPIGRLVVKDQQSHLPELTSPFVGDCEEDHSYDILEDDSAVGASHVKGIYSYARNEGLSALNSNYPERHYDQADTRGSMTLWPGESNSGAVEDDYNHILSQDRSKQKTGHPAGQREPTPYSLARGRRENECNENTSQDDEDGYNMLHAGNRLPSGFNGQGARTCEMYDHVTGDVHGDYDRIRQGDRSDIIGSDYDHVI